MEEIVIYRVIIVGMIILYLISEWLHLEQIGAAYNRGFETGSQGLRQNFEIIIFNYLDDIKKDIRMLREGDKYVVHESPDET